MRAERRHAQSRKAARGGKRSRELWRVQAYATDYRPRQERLESCGSGSSWPRGPPQRWHARLTAARHTRARRSIANRSEEHTSELQSLMRNSYAVFCLTKKNQPNAHNHNYADAVTAAK